MYLGFYQLKDEPFRLSPDPRFLQRAHQSALKTLVAGIAQRKGLMVLTGPIGVGKTTVINTLLTLLNVLSKSSGRKFPSALIVNPRLERDELLELLLADFQISSAATSKPQRLLALQTLFLAAQKAGGTALVVIDEAHLLSNDVLEELRLLMNADSYRGKLLQIILCGQPELDDRLRHPELEAVRQRIASAVTLRALDVAETGIYIAQRLRAAGLKGPVPFSDPGVEIIHKFTRGVPRLINTICNTCLMIGFERKSSEIGEDIVEEALGANELAILHSSMALQNAKGDLVAMRPSPVEAERINATTHAAWAGRRES